MKSAIVFLVCLVAAVDANAVSETASSLACNNTFSQPSGIITSPNYPNIYNENLDCFETISTSSDSTIVLIFESFETESCCDFITISCSGNLSYPRQQFSGYSIPYPISIPWCAKGLINFRTDGSVAASGFSLDYYISKGGCGNTLFTGSIGYVTSSNYPNAYGSYEDCYNIIWAPQRSTFYLQFIFFHLEAEVNNDCIDDWLEVRCLDNSTSVPTRYCGEIPFFSTYVYGCSQLLLWFHADSSNHYPGFNITYEVYPESGTTQTTPTTTANSLCGVSDYFGWSGVISSPNYPDTYYDYLYCFYNIHALPNSTFTIIFDSFNTQSDFDFVKISCQSNSSFLPEEYSGNSLPVPVSIPWCSQGLIHFRTDYATVDTGFSLKYYLSEGGCGRTVYTEFNGNVTSPSYPSNYGNNQNCSNIIWAPKRSTFHLHFHQLQLDFDCNRDWLEIGCSDYGAYDPQRFCGQSNNFSLNINSCNQLLLWFHSDGSTNHQGFKVEYTVYLEPGTPTPSPTTTYSTPVTTLTTGNPTTSATTRSIIPSTATGTPTPSTTTKSTIPSTTRGTTLSGTTRVTSGTTGTTQSTLTPPVSECGETSYYGPSGVISSPNHPGDYSNDLSCDYYIEASSSSSSIAIIFQAFDTEQCCDYVEISCPTNSSRPSVKFSGSSLPQPLSIPWCSQGAVNFITDDSTVSSGFSLDYHISLGGCGDTVYSGSHGYVSSPNYPGNYGLNQNCSNIIWASQRSSFSIKFQYMIVEDGSDFVELSCLDNAESGSYRFTGTSIPPKLDIPGCTQVLVWFYTDDTVVFTGFNLEYIVTPESGSTLVKGFSSLNRAMRKKEVRDH